MISDDMTADDMGLLQEYAQNNSEQAFAGLVSRHTNLVYSVALRRVHNPHLAQEIAQTVFIILAQKAKSLSPKTILPGWLCRTARYVSADTLKTQRRRQMREQESQMQPSLNEPASEAWSQIAPLLDEALDCLGEREHDAIVLRFFGDRDLRQVGAAMGIAEDAARMRVNRAVEKLRKYFIRRGVSLSATTIAGSVAENSIQAAPAGLASSITAAVLSGTTVATGAVLAATKAVAMTTLQKTVITLVFASAMGAGIYEASQAANARSKLQTLQQQQIPLTDQIQRLQRERDETARQLASLRDDNERLNRDTGELLRLRGEVAQLRRVAQARSQPNATSSQPAELQDLVSSVTAKLKDAALVSITEKYPSVTPPDLSFSQVMIRARPDGSEVIDVNYTVPATAEEKLGTPEQGKKTISVKEFSVLMSLSGQVQHVSEGVSDAIYGVENR
jgi:RNA polymerase sigma factor (sigma-70 family)